MVKRNTKGECESTKADLNIENDYKSICEEE
jgi:hypothetical protein